MSMLKTITGKIFQNIKGIMRPLSSQQTDNIEDLFTCRYECFFSRPNIDGWEIRQAMNDIVGYDVVPDPRIIRAVLLACRRVDDFALTVRFLESVKDKCAHEVETIWPYIVQEIRPTLCELGCNLPEDLCYDEPELFLKSVFDMH